jgi:hypothetical protein
VTSPVSAGPARGLKHKLVDDAAAIDHIGDVGVIDVQDLARRVGPVEIRPAERLIGLGGSPVCSSALAYSLQRALSRMLKKREIQLNRILDLGFRLVGDGSKTR